MDGLAERAARSVNESAEDVCGDFFRRELASERAAVRAATKPAPNRPDGSRGRRCRGRRRRRRRWRTPRRERGGRPRPRAWRYRLPMKRLTEWNVLAGSLSEALARRMADQRLRAVGCLRTPRWASCVDRLVRDDHGLAVHDHARRRCWWCRGRYRRWTREAPPPPPGRGEHARSGSRRGARGDTETRARGRRTGRTRAMRGEHRERRRHRASTRVERTRAHVGTWDFWRSLPQTRLAFRRGPLPPNDTRRAGSSGRPARCSSHRDARVGRPPSTSCSTSAPTPRPFPSPSLSSRARFPPATGADLVAGANNARMVDQAKLSEFLGVTGCDDPAKAQFFLESANGDLGAAVSAFYEHGDAPTDAPDPSPLRHRPDPRGDPDGRGTRHRPRRAPRARARLHPRRVQRPRLRRSRRPRRRRRRRREAPGVVHRRRAVRLGGAGSQKAAVQRRKTRAALDGCQSRRRRPRKPRGSSRAAARGPAPSPARDAPSDPPPAGRRTRGVPLPKGVDAGALRLVPRPRRPPLRRTPSPFGPTGSPSTTELFARTMTRRRSRSCSPWGRSALASFSPRIPTRPSTSTS